MSNIAPRAFSVATPTLWNTLLIRVRSVETITKFRHQLKPYLYKLVCRSCLYSVSIEPSVDNNFYTVYRFWDWSICSNYVVL